jgi:hypothetical protein
MRGRGRDLRRAVRMRRRNAAWIGLPSGGATIPCVLWDISDTGARLAAPRSKSLPAAFNLFLTKDGKNQRQCRVVWRTERQVGVRFIETSDLEYEAFRGQRTAIAAPSGAVATASLVLPGYGSQFLDKPAAPGLRISTFAGGMTAMLAAATALLLVAGLQSAADVPWAVSLCDGAANFCRHPEWTGVASALSSVVFFAVRGMES